MQRARLRWTTAYGVVNLFGGGLRVDSVTSSITGRAQGGFSTVILLHSSNLEHTPLITAAAVGFSVILAAVSGVLAFLIFRRNRFAVVAMLVLVIALQLYTWFVAHSLAGTLVSVVVVAFLLRGARRMFQDHAERQMEAGKV